LKFLTLIFVKIY